MNELENKFKQEAKKRGYIVYQNGWPDFAVEKVDGNKRLNVAFFVEEKSNNGKISRAQEKMFGLLERMGYPVMISRDGEWVEPIIINDRLKQLALLDDLSYHRSRLENLKDAINKTLKEVEKEIKKLTEVEEHLTNDS